MKNFTILFFLFSSFLFADTLVPKNVITLAEKKYGTFSKNRFIAINNELLNKLKNAKEIKKLHVVNRWVNGIKYKSDKSLYGVSDYWATLYEFVGKNGGDCEDYTIAKYFILKELGVNPRRMKFTYVIYKNKKGKKISHMVLAYFKVAKPKSKNDILILGNNNRLVLPASKRKDIIKVIKMINGDTGPKSKKWKRLEANMQRKKL